jgi:hypothetical protein
MVNHSRMISTAENSSFVHQRCLAILPAESSSSKATENGEEIMNLVLRDIFVHTWKGSLTRGKILHETETLLPSEARCGADFYRP